jgi:L-iditol 2-dehydrogenase
MPDEVAILIDPLATSVQAVERAMQPGTPDRGQGFGPGKSVLVQGSGAIGLLAANVAKLAGASPVIVIGAPAGRLELCRQFGADYVIGIAEVADPSDRLRLVQDLTLHNLGPDVVLECAGLPAAFAEGLDLVRRGGCLVEVGHFTSQGKVAIDPYVICQKQLHLFGCWCYTYQSMLTGFRLLQANRTRYDYTRLVTHRFDLAHSQEAMETARRQECLKAAVTP